jgi:hypothetical protein
MRTLKEELQEIVNFDKLNVVEFICVHLSPNNRKELQQYRNMAKDYAKKYVHGRDFCWWHLHLDDEIITKYINSEKYRFIKDLIAIL